MDDLTIEHSLDLQATWAIGVLGIFFDMLSMCVCKTRQWQTSGRLVQELIVGTVHASPMVYRGDSTHSGKYHL